MDTQVINISLPDKLLKLVDKVADKEARSRSELFREAIRTYVLRKVAWDEIFEYGDAKAKNLKISEKETQKIIASYRSNNS